MWVNLAAVLFSALRFIIITHFGKHRAVAHLVTFAIYLSTVGVMVISGGIHSSSVGWQVFVPIAAFIMSGLWTGLSWGVLCLITVIVAYVLETAGITKFTGFEVNMFDRLIDLGGAILATSIAIWYSDRLKSRSLTQLEEAKAQLNYYATIDPLTNIFNRRHFLELSERKIKRTYTTHGHASFLLFDIDHFKKINDKHGHIIGDQVLRGIAQTCVQHLRPNDVLEVSVGRNLSYCFQKPNSKMQNILPNASGFSLKHSHSNRDWLDQYDNKHRGGRQRENHIHKHRPIAF